MSKFGTKSRAARVTRQVSPVRSKPVSTVATYNGGAGYERDAKSELFLLAVTNMVSEDTFYESASQRDSRFSGLVQTVTREDPDWVARMLRWLRTEANMRSASVAGAVEYVLAGGPNGAAVVDSVCVRADEPGEVLAYYDLVTHKGISAPKPIKRGVARAVRRLYNERNALKWDGNRLAWRFSDVIQATHPRPTGPWQSDLFKWLMDARYNNVQEIPESLPTVHARAVVEKVPVSQRREFLEQARMVEGSLLRESGMSWEDLSGWLQGPMDALAWESVIPNMGYMALLRNLRNFDQAGVNENVLQDVARRLADPGEVKRSRQFPMRFLSAYRNAPSLRWSWPLEQALQYSLQNIPTLQGRTLILADMSTSMDSPFSRDSSLMRWDAAVVFAVALAQRCYNVDLVAFSSAQRYYNDPPGTNTKVFPLVKGSSVLKDVERWKREGYFLGGGTETAASLRQLYSGHDRVVILTDEQADYDGTEVSNSMPQNKMLFTFNLAGYSAGHASSGTRFRHTFGGLTDAGFKMIPILESAGKASWPF